MKAASALVALALACQPSHVESPPFTPDDPDTWRAAPYPDDEPDTSDACVRAGRKLWGFRCPEAGRTQGVTFPAFCRTRQRLIDADCIASARSLADLRGCHVKCLQGAP